MHWLVSIGLVCVVIKAVCLQYAIKRLVLHISPYADIVKIWLVFCVFLRQILSKTKLS